MGASLQPSSLTLAHFNNDTHPDLAVTLTDNDTVSIALGNRDQSFSQASFYPLNISSSTSSMVAGEANVESCREMQ